jgi:hypothetical protein
LTSVVPIDMQSLEPTAAPFPDGASIVDWYEAHPNDGAAVCTGDQGGWSLVGVKVRTWGAWTRWLQSDAMDTVVRPFGEYDKVAAVKSVRPIGRATLVGWERAEDPDPHKLGHIGAVTRGHEAGRQAALRGLLNVTTGPDGGWYLWPVRADEQGRLPSFRARSISGDIEVCPSGYPVPVSGVRQGLRLRTADRVMGRPDDTSTDWLPDWLADRFGARYR